MNKNKTIQSQQLRYLRKNQFPRKISPIDHRTMHNPFTSKAQRFNYQYSPNPGPGTYDQILRQKHTMDYHVSKDQSCPQKGKQYLWITSKGRQLFQGSDLSKISIGPGAYYDSNLKRKSDHSNWGKNKRFNYEKDEAPTNVGPGLYELKQPIIKRSPTASSVFNSKTPKFNLAQTVKQHLKSQQNKFNPEIDFEEIEEEAQQAANLKQKQIQSNKKSMLSPVFKSKCERLPKTDTDQIGPGSYSIESSLLKKNVVKSRRIVTDAGRSKSKQRILDKHHSSKIVSPGPGAYLLANEVVQSVQVVKKPLLGLMLREDRFKSSSRSERVVPGPGQYNFQRQMSNRIEFNVKLHSGSKPKYVKKLSGGDRGVRNHLIRRGEYPLDAPSENICQIYNRLQQSGNMKLRVISEQLCR